MKTILLSFVTVLTLVSCAYTTDGSVMPTRVLDEGTRITLTVGDTVIPAILNDSIASKDLVSRLPNPLQQNCMARYSLADNE